MAESLRRHRASRSTTATEGAGSLHRAAHGDWTMVRADVHQRDVAAVEHPELDVEQASALVTAWTVPCDALDVNHLPSARGRGYEVQALTA